MRKGLRSLGGVVALAGFALAFSGCDVGPFPDFLEQLDVINPVEGEADGWIYANDEETHILVLSEHGQFMHSIVNRDTSVDVEFGTFVAGSAEVRLEREARFEFPKETGDVTSRDGAREIDPRADETMAMTIVDDVLTWGEFGTFSPTQDFVAGLVLEDSEDRGCLLKYIQLSLRTAQARIKKLGGGGTVIYRNNESSFVGFLGGEQSIVVENLTSPDTTMSYEGFLDFPEVEIEGAFVSHVDLSGDGTLDDSLSFRIFLGEGATESGLGGASSGRHVVAEAELFYGRDAPIRIGQADVVGGSYDFELKTPLTSEDNFGWEFLDDLDMRSCLAP